MLPISMILSHAVVNMLIELRFIYEPIVSGITITQFKMILVGFIIVMLTIVHIIYNKIFGIIYAIIIVGSTLISYVNIEFQYFIIFGVSLLKIIELYYVSAALILLQIIIIVTMLDDSFELINDIYIRIYYIKCTIIITVNFTNIIWKSCYVSQLTNIILICIIDQLIKAALMQLEFRFNLICINNCSINVFMNKSVNLIILNSIYTMIILKCGYFVIKSFFTNNNINNYFKLFILITSTLYGNNTFTLEGYYCCCALFNVYGMIHCVSDILLRAQSIKLNLKKLITAE
jgi:hypothetical protein